ncbi:LysR family transcriptional regulator [Verticiella sediminum]|uniref:LysR family transcriptional regulator n=1 Tax=Verticiella sediminum TaxID=1247510 RepID=A0A556AL66_9BURK|nr:LysR family transcriptional regulator [Verticiella sediminum]TSH93619.1 LysR family transcriptional regulator [Verticiella sediminum]
MDLEEIDLNLLLVLHHLLDTRSVSRTAQRLGITQPGVSNALKRLRTMLEDDVFVRTADGMQATPYALELAAPVQRALDGLRTALSQGNRFEPAHSQREFTIAMSDLGEVALLPALMEGLATAAPGVALHTVRNDGADLADAMQSGRVDLALGLITHLPKGTFQRRLFAQRYVCLYRRGHAFDGRKPSLRRFFAAEHVTVSQGAGHARADRIIEAAGTRRVRLRVPHFVSVAPLVAGSDLVATVPERYAQRLAGPFGLAYCPHPVALPSVDINLFWHARFHRDPANRWLRGFVVAHLGE